MVKIIGSVLVLVSTYAIGSLFALRIKEHENWLKDMKLALFLLLGELEYRQTPMPEALRLIAKRHGGVLSSFFEDTAEELEKKEGLTMKELWQQQAGIFLKDSPLNKEQRMEFSELGIYFMETDRDTRRNALDFYLSRLEEDIIGMRENGADKAYLCRTLGMLGGAFLLILVL